VAGVQTRFVASTSGWSVTVVVTLTGVHVTLAGQGTDAEMVIGIPV
jgi:hypothetical protein